MPDRRGFRGVRLLAVACVVAATLAGACSPRATTRNGSTVPIPNPPAWRSCHGTFECATVVVPRDYAAPQGPKFNLALVRLPASDPSRRIGSLVVNPGGPGGSGVEFIVQDAEIVFPSDVRARFDIVGFDPRGVGLSDPILCSGDMPPSTFTALETQDEIDAAIQANRELADGCKADMPELPYMGTENVARDLESIRLALDDGTINYFGFSYGTLIGAIYADMFPRSIRTLVLDGAMDPALDILAVRRGQAAAFEKALGTFLDACASSTACAFHSEGNTRDAFAEVMAQDSSPDAWMAIVSILYLDDSGYTYLASALEQAALGDTTAVERLVGVDPSRNRDAFYINEAVSYHAVTCLDFAPPADSAAYTTLSSELDRSAPHFGAMLGLADVGCAFWPTKPTRHVGAVHGAGAPPIVVVGSTGDPATPYDWAVSLSKELPSSVLVTRDGVGHTGYMFNECVREAVDGYLFDRKPPQSGLTCS